MHMPVSISGMLKEVSPSRNVAIFITESDTSVDSHTYVTRGIVGWVPACTNVYMLIHMNHSCTRTNLEMQVCLLLYAGLRHALGPW